MPSPLVEADGRPLDGDVLRPLADRRILLVEDLPEPTRDAARLLCAAGAQVVLEYHALAAVGLVQRSAPPFDAVVLDLQLSIFDTLEGVRRLRQIGFPQPIVGVIPPDQALVSQALQRAGCTVVLPRPLDAALLVTTLSAIQRPSCAVSDLGRAGATEL